MAKNINPNSDKDYIDQLDLSNPLIFPKFLKGVEFCPFRHIENLVIKFNHPISVISGTNRSGKSTVLMALACSHFDFKKRNVQNGKLERQTWSSIMQFTSHDTQLRDWNYYISYKLGSKEERKRGQRKASTKKWNGVGKKESQVKDRQVIFLDLDRISPARNFGQVLFKKAANGTVENISKTKIKEIEKYVSYVLEENFKLDKIAAHLDKDIFKYSNNYQYSSYNAATGEEVLTKILIDVVEAPNNSLILIDEIEIGLHPKIQRRLISALYNIARNENKQFILTTHSPTVLSSLPDQSRIFIEKHNDVYKAIPNISVNAALSKMDSVSYPLVDLYCEDDIAEKIINYAISAIQTKNALKNFSNLINVIVSGSANKTYSYYKAHQDTYPHKRIKTGYGCILDGDMKAKTSNNSPQYPPEETLHFLYSDKSPEHFLVGEFNSAFEDSSITYHLKNSDPHCLFEKMVENSKAINKQDAFEKCWEHFVTSDAGAVYFELLQHFILSVAKKFSPDL